MRHARVQRARLPQVGRGCKHTYHNKHCDFAHLWPSPLPNPCSRRVRAGQRHKGAVAEPPAQGRQQTASHDGRVGRHRRLARGGRYSLDLPLEVDEGSRLHSLHRVPHWVRARTTPSATVRAVHVRPHLPPPLPGYTDAAITATSDA